MLATKTRIAERDRRIILQKKVVEDNAFNESEVTGWETVCCVRAKVSESQGDESYQSDQLTESRLTVFDIRYKSGLTVEMRILYNDRVYDIRSIIEPDRRRSLKIKAELLDER